MPDKYPPNYMVDYHTKIEISKEVMEGTIRIINGQRAKYDPELHCRAIIEICSDGGDVPAFCSKFFINRDTFHDWLDKHPEFEEAYLLAKDRGSQYYEKMINDNKDNPNFNLAAITFLMRNRYGYTNDRRIRIKGMSKAKTHNERLHTVDKQVDVGNLTAKEAQCFANYVAISAKIDEVTQQAADIEALKKLTEERS